MYIHTHSSEGKRSNEQILDISCRSILIRTSRIFFFVTLKNERECCGCNQRCSLCGLICSRMLYCIYTHTSEFPWITFLPTQRGDWSLIFSYSPFLFSMAWFIRMWITFDVITHSCMHCHYAAFFGFFSVWIDLLFWQQKRTLKWIWKVYFCF